MPRNIIEHPGGLGVQGFFFLMSSGRIEETNSLIDQPLTSRKM